MITQQQLKGQWTALRGKIKERWGQLTDNDLLQAEGDVDQLVGKIQQKTGEARKNIEEFLERSMRAATPMVESVVENASAVAEKATAAVQSGYRSAEQTVRQGYQAAEQGMKQGYEAAEQQVRARPVESMLTVFGLGALVGAALALMMRHDSA